MDSYGDGGDGGYRGRGGGGYRGRGRGRGGGGGYGGGGGGGYTPDYQKPPSTNIPYETNKCKF